MPERSVAPRWYVSVLVALLAAALWSGEADGAGVHGVVVERVVAERVGVERAPPRLHVAALAGPPHDEVRRFGDVLAANGRLVAIGAPTAGDDALSPGAVHIVRLEDGSTSGLTPILCATFLSREEGEHFGGALAMTRMRDRLGRLSILAIGADRASATAPTGQSSLGTAEGAVEILRSRSDPSQPEGSNPWLLEDRITSTEPEPGAEFGGALAFDSGYRVQLASGSVNAWQVLREYHEELAPFFPGLTADEMVRRATRSYLEVETKNFLRARLPLFDRAVRALRGSA